MSQSRQNRGQGEPPDTQDRVTIGEGGSGRFDTDRIREILPQLVDAMSDAVLVVDRSFRVVAANQRYVEAFGLQQDDVVGLSCHDSVSCPMLGAARAGGGRCVACEVVDRREPRRVLRTMPDATGVVRRWEATLNPVLDDRGDVSHVVEVWRDVTERSQLEGQLSHSERLASLGMLAAGVAHEINNPMASILAGVESLRRWTLRAGCVPAEDREELEEILGVLDREIQRSRETTDKLLLLGQPVRTAPQWVDVNRAASDTLSLLSYQTRKQGVTVVEELADDLPQVWGREGGVRGILMNLCMNAAQAMPDGGTLTIRTAPRDDGIVIEIGDTGVGIQPQHLDRIWDPFFTTKPTGQGTGLGLSITQRIVARHGGTIRVTSAPGQGARFVVELPLQGSGGTNV